jgi:hypothetical protein
MVADDPESFADLDGHDGNGSTVGPGASWAGVSNAGGGRLTEGQVAGMGDDAPTVVDRIEPGSVLQARADQFMEWARATGNAGFGAHNQAVDPSDKKSRIPAHAIIKSHHRTKNHAANTYTYQLTNAAGKKLRGKGYETEEHIQEIVTVGNVRPIFRTSEGEFVGSPQGEVTDTVGLRTPFVKGDYYFHMVSQTFTVRYQGNEYNLTIQFVHIVKAADGSVLEASVGVVIP